MPRLLTVYQLGVVSYETALAFQRRVVDHLLQRTKQALLRHGVKSLAAIPAQLG